MEAVFEKGLTKSIGVSNYTTPLLWDMQTYAKIKPVCNQMESHPYNQQNEVREVGLRFGTAWEAYTVIGNWQFMKNLGIQYLLDDEEIKKIAAKHSKTPAQICIAWALNRGIAIVKASSSERMQENFDAQAIILSEEDMQALNSLDKNISYRLFGNKLFGFPYYS